MTALTEIASQPNPYFHDGHRDKRRLFILAKPYDERNLLIIEQRYYIYVRA